MVTLDAILARIAELDAKATPGPWTARDAAAGTGTIAWGVESPEEIVVLHDFIGPSDAQFVALSRTALPAMAAKVREMREALKDCLGRDGGMGLYDLGQESVSGLSEPELSECVAAADSIVASARKALEGK